MKELKIYLKSGQIVEVVCQDANMSRNGYGTPTKLNWDNVAGEETLMDIDMDQVAAITYKEREGR